MVLFFCTVKKNVDGSSQALEMNQMWLHSNMIRIWENDRIKIFTWNNCFNSGLRCVILNIHALLS